MPTELAKHGPTGEGLTQGIEEIIASIFENMLDLPASHRAVVSGWICQETVRSLVTFTGSWHGMVSMECTRTQARHFAQRFLSLPACQIDDQVAWDVLGELTNMIAGNLKPLLASDIQLSISTVPWKEGEPALDFLPEIRRELIFSCAEGDFVTRLLAAPSH